MRPLVPFQVQIASSGKARLVTQLLPESDASHVYAFIVAPELQKHCTPAACGPDASAAYSSSFSSTSTPSHVRPGDEVGSTKRGPEGAAGREEEDEGGGQAREGEGDVAGESGDDGARELAALRAPLDVPEGTGPQWFYTRDERTWVPYASGNYFSKVIYIVDLCIRSILGR